jgi:hypothetical protein
LTVDELKEINVGRDNPFIPYSDIATTQ